MLILTGCVTLHDLTDESSVAPGEGTVAPSMKTGSAFYRGSLADHVVLLTSFPLDAERTTSNESPSLKFKSRRHTSQRVDGKRRWIPRDLYEAVMSDVEQSAHRWNALYQKYSTSCRGEPNWRRGTFHEVTFRDSADPERQSREVTLFLCLHSSGAETLNGAMMTITLDDVVVDLTYRWYGNRFQTETRIDDILGRYQVTQLCRRDVNPEYTEACPAGLANGSAAYAQYCPYSATVLIQPQETTAEFRPDRAIWHKAVFPRVSGISSGAASSILRAIPGISNAPFAIPSIEEAIARNPGRTHVVQVAFSDEGEGASTSNDRLARDYAQALADHWTKKRVFKHGQIQTGMNPSCRGYFRPPQS